ncbi:MAG: class I tRNA ligase family protein, partial [Halodesulfurarchaeum sp.]
VDDYLDTGFDTDLLRYYITTAGNFERDVDFSWDRFQERINSELADDVGNFVYRSLLFARRNYDGTPDVPISGQVRAEIESAMANYREAINEYSINRVGAIPVELARFGNEYIQQNEPWKLVDEDPDEASQVIRDTVQLVKAIAVTIAPITPETAQETWEQLGESGSIHDAQLDACLADPPATFDEPTELVEKIEDDTIEALNEDLRTSIEAAETSDSAVTTDEGDEDDTTTMSEYEPLSDERIDFEEFERLDIRVGEIISAAPIEGADKLVKLTVDIGVEERQVVAGIRQLHDVDGLPGTAVILLANLETAELFGVESNGMILAAGEEADLLTTHGNSDPGTKIR